MSSDKDIGLSARRNFIYLAVGVAALCMMAAAVLMCGDESSQDDPIVGDTGGMHYEYTESTKTLAFTAIGTGDERGVMGSDSDKWGWKGLWNTPINITFGDGCKSIYGTNVEDAETPFQSMTILSLDLGTVEEIGPFAFQHSKGTNANEQYALDLKNVETVMNNAFGDARISSIHITPSVQTIEAKAFATYVKYGFSPLPMTITIDEGVESIGPAAFAYRQFQTLTIPASVTEIGNLAFAGNPVLESITVAKGNANFKVIDGALASIDGKRILLYPAAIPGGAKTYCMPDTVETMDAGSFAFMSVLETLVVSSKVTVIPEAAFYFYTDVKTTSKETSLANVYLPDGITTVYNTSYMGLKMDMFLVPQSFNGSIQTDKLTGLYDYKQPLYVKEIYNDCAAATEVMVKNALKNAYDLTETSDYPSTYKGQGNATIDADGTTINAHVGTSVYIAPPSKPNCRFLGWTTVATDCDPSLPGDTILISSDMAGKTTKLYSCWATTVNYDLNGGSGQLGPEDAKIRGKVTLSDGTDIQGPQGEQLASWNTSKDGSGKSYLPGAVLDVADYTVLYAQWGSAPGPTPPTPPSPPSDGQGFDWIVIAAITAAAITSIWAIIPIAKRRKDDKEQ